MIKKVVYLRELYYNGKTVSTKCVIEINLQRFKTMNFDLLRLSCNYNKKKRNT